MTADLAWEEGTTLSGRAGQTAVRLDWESKEGPSPVQALALALAGCMAADLVLILQKGRLPLEGLRARLTGERAPKEPRRFVKIALHFEVSGDVPADKVERAIALSRETYCSVWHSLRHDIELTTSFEVFPSA